MAKTISMSQLTKNAERIAADIETAGTVYRIRRPGHRSMLRVDHQYFEGRLAAIELKALHPNWKEEMEEGRRDFREGRTIPLEVVLKKLGLDEPRANSRGRSRSRRVARGRRTKAR